MPTLKVNWILSHLTTHQMSSRNVRTVHWYGHTRKCTIFSIRIEIAIVSGCCGWCDYQTTYKKKNEKTLNNALATTQLLTINSFCRSCSVIVQVRVVLKRTVASDSDWRFDNLSGSHHHSQGEKSLDADKGTALQFLLCHLTLMMTFAQVVKTSVTVTDNSPFQDYPHLDNHTSRLTVTSKFKPFTVEQ